MKWRAREKKKGVLRVSSELPHRHTSRLQSSSLLGVGQLAEMSGEAGTRRGSWDAPPAAAGLATNDSRRDDSIERGKRKPLNPLPPITIKGAWGNAKILEKGGAPEAELSQHVSTDQEVRGSPITGSPTGSPVQASVSSTRMHPSSIQAQFRFVQSVKPPTDGLTFVHDLSTRHPRILQRS